MDEINNLIILYDYYGNLLTSSQQNYFVEYYFNNLSLSEISENLNVSRNAVHKQLRVACDKLLEYEEKLKFLDKTNKLRALVLKEADEKHIGGKDVTPFLLDKVKTITEGKSLASNIELVYNNAKVAANIAKDLASLNK